MNSCEPCGENLSKNRQFGAIYGVCRPEAPSPSESKFDPDGLLNACIALSRIVYPTSFGLDYAARIRRQSDGTRTIIPGIPFNLNPHAFVSDERSNWLVPNNVPLLRDLVAAYLRQDAPQRVRSAMWHHESAFREYFVSSRWAILVTGLEALIHVRGEKDPTNVKRHAGSTRVFAQRLSAVAVALGLTLIDDAMLREIYRRRSEIVHGVGLVALDSETKSLYESTELLLSRCVREALLNPAFSVQFATDTSVTSAFPLT